MACGFDLLAAQACVELGIPFIAAVPFVNQEAFFSPQDVILYNKLLKKAAAVEIVSQGTFAVYKYQKRNEWICDNSDQLLCYLIDIKSGTANCVEFMKKLNKPIHNLASQQNA